MRRAALAVIFAGSLAMGCGGKDECSIDADCFSGEYCSADRECVVGPRPTNSSNGTTNAQNSGADAGNGGDATNGTPNNSFNNAMTCQIDPIGNTCTDDEYEENDLYTQQLPIPIAQDSWCVDGELVETSQSFSGTLCPGDQADLFRLQIDNRLPHECLSPSFTIKITVELDRPCDSAEFVRIFPYLSFANPILNSPCGQNDDLRCTVSDDQKTYTFQWVWQSEQLVDQRLNIQPRGDDVQVDYTVTMEVIQ